MFFFRLGMSTVIFFGEVPAAVRTPPRSERRSDDWLEAKDPNLSLENWPLAIWTLEYQRNEPDRDE